MTIDPIYQDLLDGFAASQADNCRSNRDRLDDAKKALDYYAGNFNRYRNNVWRENPDLLEIPWRSMLLARQVVDHLTAHLYRNDPVRTIADNPDATDFLQKVYASNHMHAKWQFADKLTIISQACAYQVAGTEDPNNPIKINLWDAGQFVVYASDDDPTKPATVVTLDSVDSGNRRRYQVWTADSYRVYLSEHKTEQVKKLTLVQDEPNPYGVLPFSFVHYSFPVLNFWSGCPGQHLVEANSYVNYRLTDLALDIGQLKPTGVAANVAPEWSPKGKYRVGQWYMLPGENDSAGNPLGDPSLSYAEPSLGYVDSSWADLENYISTVLEGCGVPESAVRAVQSGARSGVSVIAEQAPLMSWALSRQPHFADYETDLARTVLAVACSHLKNNGVVKPALLLALDDFHLHVRWGEVYPPVLPGPDKDNADLFEMNNGLKSKLMIIEERYNMTREEALGYLEQLAEDKEDMDEIIKPEEPVVPPAASTDQAMIPPKDEETDKEEKPLDGGEDDA